MSFLGLQVGDIMEWEVILEGNKLVVHVHKDESDD